MTADPAGGRSLRALLCLLVASGGLAGAAGPAAACSLNKSFEIDLEQTPGNRYLVTATVAGKPVKMVLDTGSPFSFLPPDMARDLPKSTSPVEFTDVYGDATNDIVRIPDFRLGSFLYRHADFGVLERFRQPIMGTEFFLDSDIEIDPAAGKLRVFQHTDCGNPIYWPHSDGEKLPVDLDSGQHLNLTVDLDGRKLRAIIDTGAPYTTLNALVAEGRFDLDPARESSVPPDDPGSPGNGDHRWHRFELLQMGGLKFHNPVVALAHLNRMIDETGSRNMTRKFDEQVSLLVGIHQLRNLHLFIAYGQSAVFLSSIAGDKAAAAAAATAPTPASK